MKKITLNQMEKIQGGNRFRNLFEANEDCATAVATMAITALASTSVAGPVGLGIFLFTGVTSLRSMYKNCR